MSVFERFIDPTFRSIIESRRYSSIDTLTSLTVQNRKLSSIEDIHFFTNLTAFYCSINQITSIKGIRTLSQLKTLNIAQNQIRDIEPLSNLLNLTQLELGDNPIQDFKPLLNLPNLRKLTISREQLPEFKKISSLPQLEHLTATLDSVEELPDLPNLRSLSIQAVEATRLQGIERFTNLENLSAGGNFFSDIAPLNHLKKLTHVNLSNNPLEDIAPIISNRDLRSLSLINCPINNIEPLFQLPLLHGVSLNKTKVIPADIHRLSESLSLWDTEFEIAHPIFQPSLQIKLVSEAEFNHFNHDHPFNVDDFDGNMDMFGSERGWIVNQIKKAIDGEIEDIIVPYTGGIRRSQAVYSNSEKAVKKYRLIVNRIQAALCRAKREWIIYLEFNVNKPLTIWVYPDHLVVEEKDKGLLRKFLR